MTACAVTAGNTLAASPTRTAPRSSTPPRSADLDTNPVRAAQPGLAGARNVFTITHRTRPSSTTPPSRGGRDVRSNAPPSDPGADTETVYRDRDARIAVIDHAIHRGSSLHVGTVRILNQNNSRSFTVTTTSGPWVTGPKIAAAYRPWTPERSPIRPGRTRQGGAAGPSPTTVRRGPSRCSPSPTTGARIPPNTSP